MLGGSMPQKAGRVKEEYAPKGAHLTFFGSADILVGANEKVKQWPTRMSALPTALLAMSEKCEMRPAESHAPSNPCISASTMDI